ncbi:hypothetical protein ACPOL_7059 (plasmid) [Acidisarcina polymorpha]|uniref:Uncharacterized protein n=1 Tax=Acidisarcina polymorpha TaxID=2211140 RepID=A0A2Z5GBU9_9BACT|nr:hypothetical protein [Acidisarcina polymorpha]AXC16257.1 hypothetical protein ACPOL_7059 [Acidisarcina polymorpha]
MSLLSAAPITWFQPESPAALVPSEKMLGPETTMPSIVIDSFSAPRANDDDFDATAGAGFD